MTQIIALGGGGFSMEPDNLALDQYILKQSAQTQPKVCFIPTASGESQEYVIKFFTAFSQLESKPSWLSLFKPPSKDLRSYLLDKDIIYVGGGNTRSMLALWREWELDLILQEAYDAGVILAGISAGANCWFEHCTTDSVPGEIGFYPALGFQQGCMSPHYDAEAERRPVLHDIIRTQKSSLGYGVENSAALHFVDGKLHRAIRSIPTAQAYQVSLQNDEIIETALIMQDV